MDFKVIFLLCLICLQFCDASEGVDKKTTTTTTTSSTTTPKTTSTSSSSSSSTSTVSSSSTSSTTEAPITSTTTPSPPNNPPIGEWNSTCIKLKFAAQIYFSYNTTDNKTKTSSYNLPKEMKVEDVDCTLNETESLVLNWMYNTSEENSVKFTFIKNEKTYALKMVIIKLQPNQFFPDANKDLVQLIYSNNTFVTPLKMSYHCTHQETFYLTETLGSKNITGNITFSNVQIEAFHKGDDKQPATWSFAAARDCDASNTPDIVPIAVGIALTALILIVLISYLVARRRSNARGYMSF